VKAAIVEHLTIVIEEILYLAVDCTAGIGKFFKFRNFFHSSGWDKNNLLKTRVANGC
jgi:hypothetical protein